MKKMSSIITIKEAQLNKTIPTCFECHWIGYNDNCKIKPGKCAPAFCVHGNLYRNLWWVAVVLGLLVAERVL
jgi:hypothetical protein